VERHPRGGVSCFKELPMNLDLPALIKNTSLKNKKCVQRNLESAGVVTFVRLQNLPGRYGKPYLCQNSIYDVVSELNKAIDESKEQVPTVEEVLAEEKPEPEKAPVTQETLLADLELEGIPQSKIKALQEAGIVNVGQVLKDEGAALEEIPGFGEVTRTNVFSAVKGHLET
jgi:hypothetical protein